MAIEAQGIGHAPSVDMVGLVAAGGLAFAVTLGGLGVDREDGAAGLQEALDRGPAVGLDGHRQIGIARDTLSELLPSLGGVIDAEVFDDPALGIDRHEIVMVAGPVQSGEGATLTPCLYILVHRSRPPGPG